MKRLSVIGISIGMASILLGVTGYSLANDNLFKSEITARKAGMQVAKFNIGILGAMAKGKRPYDAKLATDSAYNLHLVSLMQNGAMWPKGSDVGNKAITVKTTAKPENWTNYPKSKEYGQAFTDSSKKLSEVAGNGLDALRGAIGPVGKSCKGCHDDFRVKTK